MNSKPISARTCLLLILFFGIAAYSNTFNVPFQYDDFGDVAGNQILHPPLDLGRIWQNYPPRFVANLSFALQLALTGPAPRGFHVVNLLIHLLAAMAVFGISRLLLRTPALRETIPSSHCDLFALAPALLFLTHPVQTEAVTYIVQRLASLATLFYLATLWMYLKARLEDSRHYRLVFCLMIVALLTKEICFTLPLAILFIDFCFFPVSDIETVSRKIRRWIPFAALGLGMLLYFYTSSSGKFVENHGAVDTQISRWDYLLTQFRVLRTYLRLFVFPVNQCVDYDYRISSGWGDPDTWVAFSLLLSIFSLALALFKKHRLLAFGILWFFLTLTVESSFIPLKDVIVEHRLYLPMFGLSLFLSALLWKYTRSASRFLAILLAIAIALSAMTYARNKVWKSPFSLWQDAIKKSPLRGISYSGLGDAYRRANDDKSAAIYFEKAVALGYATPFVYLNLADIYSHLNEPTKSLYFQKLISSSPNLQKALFFRDNHALALVQQGKNSEAVEMLMQDVQMSPQNPLLHIQLGETYCRMQRDTDAISSFRKAIELAPLSKEGYDALALLFIKKGEKQKALAVIEEYLRFKKKHKPLFGEN